MGLLVMAACLIAAEVVAVATTIRALMQAPEGYEDRDGFHFGSPPDRRGRTHSQRSRSSPMPRGSGGGSRHAA